MFNPNDIIQEGELFICAFTAQTEEVAERYCKKRIDTVRGIAGSVELRNEGDRVILSSPSRNLTAHVAKLLNGYMKKMF